jgi:hypothetical protein
VSQTFIPGWETTLTFNTEDITVIASVTSFNRARSSNAKPVFGSPARRELPGQKSGTIAAQGHVSKEKIAALNGLIDSDVSVAYEIQVGTAAGATDAGKYTGNMVVTEMNLEADAEGEWDFTMAATLDGDPVYTAPTP